MTTADLAVLPPQTERDAAPDDNAKRRQILEGARAVFLRDGFDAASMNEIARVAGVSKGTLYVYFDSKASLFEALVREDRQQQAERLCVPVENEDMRGALVRFGIELVIMLARPASLAQVRTVVAVTPKFPQIGQALYEAGPRHGRNLLAAFLGRQVDKGELEIEDLELAAEQLSDLFAATIMKKLLFRVVDDVPENEIRRRVEKAVDLFLAAYGTKRPT